MKHLLVRTLALTINVVLKELRRVNYGLDFQSYHYNLGFSGGSLTELKFHLIIGDAPGVDTLIIDYLWEVKKYHRVEVYYALFNGSGRPRHRRGYRTFGTRYDYSNRDKQMCYLADYGLAIWDGRSKGTKANIDRVKKTKVILVE